MSDVNTSIPSLLKVRQYRLLYTGSTVALIGDLIFDVTVIIWLTSFYAPQSAEIALIATLSGLCVMGPMLLVGPIAGVYVDRWNKKTVLLVSNATQAVFIAGLVLVAVNQNSIPQHFIVACGLVALLVTNTASQFTGPAKLVLTARAVPAEFRTIATSVTMSTTMVLGIVAPPIAGPLYAVAGVTVAMGIHVASFALSLWFLALLEATPEPTTTHGAGVVGVWHDLKAGFQFAWNDGPLRAMLVLLFAMSVAVGALNAQMVLFLVEVLHWDAKHLGVLFAMFGASAAVGSMVAPLLMKKFGKGTAFTLTLVSIAGGIGLMGLPSMTVVIPLLGVVWCGVGSGMLNVFFGPLIMDRVSDEFMGRVGSLFGPANAAGSILSMAAGGAFLTANAGHMWSVWGIEFGRINVLYLVCAAFFAIAVLIFGRQVFANPNN